MGNCIEIGLNARDTLPWSLVTETPVMHQRYLAENSFINILMMYRT